VSRFILIFRQLFISRNDTCSEVFPEGRGMSIPADLIQRTARSTTRRNIIATGAKLAYATPLVAASMKLTSSGASAVLSIGPFACAADAGKVCGNYTSCGTTSAGNPCVCHETASGGAICGAYGDCDAPNFKPCNSDDDCGTVTGELGDVAPGFCHTATCCSVPSGYAGACAPRCQ
jgi:hypothetical protein